MSNKLIIREGNLDDLQTLVDFNLAMALETENLNLSKEVLQKGIRHGLHHPEVAQYFVAEMQGEIVGSLMITKEWSDWRNAMVAWIQSVYVLPKARRKGVYSALYQYIKQWVMQTESYSGIRLYVDKRNTNAIQTYKALGMNGEHYQLFEWMKD